jgi:hypothetical protein
MQVFSVHLLPGCDLEAEAALATGAVASRRGSERVHRTMIGRNVIVEVIRKRAKKLAMLNQSSLIMLSGPPGYGKTRLLHHLSQDEEFAGYRSELHIFRAAGNPEQRPVALTPWRAIIVVRCIQTMSSASQGQPAHDAHMYLLMGVVACEQPFSGFCVSILQCFVVDTLLDKVMSLMLS